MQRRLPSHPLPWLGAAVLLALFFVFFLSPSLSPSSPNDNELSLSTTRPSSSSSLINSDLTCKPCPACPKPSKSSKKSSKSAPSISTPCDCEKQQAGEKPSAPSPSAPALIPQYPRCPNEDPLHPTQYRTALEQQCEKDFGCDLIRRWRSQSDTWCIPPGPVSANIGKGQLVNSEMTCRRILQTRHTGQDTYCVGTNIRFDSTRLNAPMNGDPHFSRGAFTGQCRLTSDWTQDKFQLQLAGILGQGFEGSDGRLLECDSIDTTPTVFLARDGTRNVFHSMADMVNILLSLDIVGRTPEESQVVILDGQEDGPFFEVFSHLGKKNPVKRGSQIQPGTCYREAIFAIPSGSSPMWKDIWQPNECSLPYMPNGLMKRFTDHLLTSMGFLSPGTERQDAKESIQITLSSRQPKASGKVGRRIANEDELMKIMQAIPGVSVRKVDLGTLPLREQIKVMQTTHIYVGMHGAGMTNLVYLPEDSVVVEMFPKGWHQSSMRNLARYTGKVYLPWQNKHDANVVTNDPLDDFSTGGPSTTIIHPEEFKTLINQAVHVARAFVRGTGLEP